MQLYLRTQARRSRRPAAPPCTHPTRRSQVEEVALRAWGSAEGLLLEKERRSEQRVRKAAAKRRGDTDDFAAASGGAARGGKRGGKRATAPLAPLPVEHEHEFLPDEEYDAESDTWTKRCACGFSLEYEKI